MNTGVVTEIVEFKIVEGISDEEFIQRVDFLEQNFHSRQPGFIDTELVKGKEDRQWLMIQHWSTIEDAKEVIKLMMKTPVTENFRQALVPTSVRMNLVHQMRVWNKLK